jgi:hypothetical protein
MKRLADLPPRLVSAAAIDAYVSLSIRKTKAASGIDSA